MRRIHKVIVGMLIAGVLTMGIGSGIVFAEYSSFEYGGDVVMKGSQHFTKTVEYTVPIQEGKKELRIAPFYHSSYTIVEDETVSKDKIQFTIHYLSDSKAVDPAIIEMPIELDDKCAYIELNLDYEYNEFREMMRLKDYVLEDLRSSQISNYQLDGVETVEIRVHPEADFTFDVVYFDEEYYYDE